MIRIITGNPGAGKTLRGVQFLVRAKAEGRPIYYHGINGLSSDLGVLECDPRRWEDLPDGSIIVVDEAQNVWPSRRSGDPPTHVRALSTHRHRGFDFVLLTQNPAFLDKYVRDLAGEHEHVLRQWGANGAKILTWQGVEDDPRSTGARGRATVALWRYDKKLFDLYKSSTLHTVKAKLPLRLKLIPLVFLAVVAMGFMAARALTGVQQAPGKLSADATSIESEDGLIPVVNRGREKRGYASADDYLLAHTPRVAIYPGSAPVFDSRTPLSAPELYCASREDGYCVCHTEQGTRYAIERRQCIAIVRNGLYNPYRERVHYSHQVDTRPVKREEAQQYGEVPLPSVDAQALLRKDPYQTPPKSVQWHAGQS